MLEAGRRGAIDQLLIHRAGQVLVHGELAGLVDAIERHLRSSDHISCLEDGTVLVIVPEDIQSLPRLIKRVSELMRRLADEPELEVRSASRVYPGSGDSPEKLLQAVLAALT